MQLPRTILAFRFLSCLFLSTLSAAAGLLISPATRGPGPPVAGPVAGVTSLKAARTPGAGATVAVRGLVLNGAGLGGLCFVQDGEAGLTLYALK